VRTEGQHAAITIEHYEFRTLGATTFQDPAVAAVSAAAR
jgi:hypothetical protein